MSFPPGTEMFQFPGFASRPYGFRPGSPKGRGFPIRTSADQRSLASPRGFSQRATSFIASWRQGIHRTPLSCSRSQPPPPARRTEPRPTGARVLHERQWKPHHPARTHTLKTTQPIPDSPVKEQGPRRRMALARPVFWKRSRTRAYGRSRAPVRGIPMRAGIEHPPHAPCGMCGTSRMSGHREWRTEPNRGLQSLSGPTATRGHSHPASRFHP